jgi:thymidylate synthase-like protein
MTITARIIADSVSPQGIRLTTMQLRYPKFIHGEFMTHRVFSRNASSSRAIPVGRLIQDVLDDPAMPVFWGKNKTGMQAAEELTGREKDNAIAVWLNARDGAVLWAKQIAAEGVHKQIVNRIIEPWCHINVVVTATDWANFFALRRHPDAQPEMRALADAMHTAMRTSTPVPLRPGVWHLPYVEFDEQVSSYCIEPTAWPPLPVKLSVARCARVSYLTHEGKPPNVEDDLKLYDRLVGSVPLHASPAEHQATPDTFEPLWAWLNQDRPPNVNEIATKLGFIRVEGWRHVREHGNLRGWRQFRKTLLGECALEAEPFT